MSSLKTHCNAENTCTKSLIRLIRDTLSRLMNGIKTEPTYCKVLAKSESEKLPNGHCRQSSRKMRLKKRIFIFSLQKKSFFDELLTVSQFHQHFMSSLCAKIFRSCFWCNFANEQEMARLSNNQNQQTMQLNFKANVGESELQLFWI